MDIVRYSIDSERIDRRWMIVNFETVNAVRDAKHFHGHLYNACKPVRIGDAEKQILIQFLRLYTVLNADFEASLALHNRSVGAFPWPTSALRNFSHGGGSSASVNSSYLRERSHFCAAQSGGYSHVNRFLRRRGSGQSAREICKCR